MVVRPKAAGSLPFRQEAPGIELEPDEAARALEPKGPAFVTGGNALTCPDVAAADDAGRGRLVVRLEHDEPLCDCHHAASTMIRPRSIPIWQVNSCSPGSAGMHSIGTTVPVGSSADLPKSGRRTRAEQAA